METMQYLKNVVSLKLNAEKCTGCGLCVMVCPHEVFGISNGKATLINRDNCMECGACALNCSFQAIIVKSGVGCATGILNGILNNSDPNCDCSTTVNKSDCC
jgi:NAD-dependent dihydropyrimidine dehydrogenase PreA subunit